MSYGVLTTISSKTKVVVFGNDLKQTTKVVKKTVCRRKELREYKK